MTVSPTERSDAGRPREALPRPTSARDVPLDPGLAEHGSSDASGDAHRQAVGYGAEHLAKGDRRPADTLWRANPREQGLLGLTDAIAWFGANGYLVNLPLIDAQPYDLVVDDGQRLQRVQVKTTTHRSPYGVFVVRISTGGGNQSFHTVKLFDREACDLLYVLTDDSSRYLVPTEVIRSRRTLSLGARMAGYRVDPPAGCCGSDG